MTTNTTRRLRRALGLIGLGGAPQHAARIRTVLQAADGSLTFVRRDATGTPSDAVDGAAAIMPFPPGSYCVAARMPNHRTPRDLPPAPSRSAVPRPDAHHRRQLPELAKSGFLRRLHFTRHQQLHLQFGCPHSRDPKSPRARHRRRARRHHRTSTRRTSPTSRAPPMANTARPQRLRASSFITRAQRLPRLHSRWGVGSTLCSGRCSRDGRGDEDRETKTDANDRPVVP